MRGPLLARAGCLGLPIEPRIGEPGAALPPMLPLVPSRCIWAATSWAICMKRC